MALRGRPLTRNGVLRTASRLRSTDAIRETSPLEMGAFHGLIASSLTREGPAGPAGPAAGYGVDAEKIPSIIICLGSR